MCRALAGVGEKPDPDIRRPTGNGWPCPRSIPTVLNLKWGDVGCPPRSGHGVLALESQEQRMPVWRNVELVVPFLPRLSEEDFTNVPKLPQPLPVCRGSREYIRVPHVRQHMKHATIAADSHRSRLETRFESAEPGLRERACGCTPKRAADQLERASIRKRNLGTIDWGSIRSHCKNCNRGTLFATASALKTCQAGSRAFRPVAPRNEGADPWTAQSSRPPRWFAPA